MNEEVKNPDCFVPNDSAYPLCKGNGNEECKECCLYENMENDY